jgi:hypothetical protein
MKRCLAAILVLGGLAACTDPTSAPPEAIERAHYVSGEPPSLTVISMKNIASGTSEHTGLVINGSEQVLFDPAGNFRHPRAPRKDDVHYGATPAVIQAYNSFHARSDYFLKIQKIEVPLEVADALIARARSQGVTRQMFCATSIGDVLSDVPPFEGAPTSLFPAAVERYFDTYPGVETTTFYENDVGKN